MAHRILQQAPVAKPGEGARVHGLSFGLGKGGEAGQQRVAQQRVQAEPGLTRRVLDAVDKVVFAFQP
ncbi:hypothetical protein D3C86_1980600 [compost metagenome]